MPSARHVVAYQGRLRFLVYAEGFASRGGECPRCRSLFAATADSTCGYCGEHLITLDDLIGRTVARAAEAGVGVEKVRGEAAARLNDAGGVGALLRF